MILYYYLTIIMSPEILEIFSTFYGERILDVF